MKTLEINKLPKTWDEITLGQFQELTKIEIIESDQFAGIENTLAVLAVLTGIPVAELEELAMKELALLGDRISFINTPPEPSKKTSLTKWKDLDSISYNDFIVFVQNQDVLSSLDVFVKQFSKTDLTKEEIQGLPITDVLQGFFLCRKKLRQSMKLLEWSTKLEVKRLMKKEKRLSNKT